MFHLLITHALQMSVLCLQSSPLTVPTSFSLISCNDFNIFVSDWLMCKCKSAHNIIHHRSALVQCFLDVVKTLRARDETWPLSPVLFYLGDFQLFTLVSCSCLMLPPNKSATLLEQERDGFSCARFKKHSPAQTSQTQRVNTPRFEQTVWHKQELTN